jgi:hypothetical protein
MNSKNLICFASAIILTKPSKSPLALARPNALKGFQPYNPPEAFNCSSVCPTATSGQV